MKKKQPIQYFYSIENLSESPDETAFKAVIPAINAIVYGDTLQELEEGIRFTIETVIDDLKKKGRPVPAPDLKRKRSGKFLVRIQPELHERLALEARARRKPLNQIVAEKLAA